MEKSAFGKIIQGVGGLYTVRILSDGALPVGSLLQCRARGSFRHEGLTPLPGDNVTLLCADSVDQKKEEAGWVIDEIGTRTCALIRPPLANLNVLFITMAAASPTPILSTVDKLIAIAEYNRINFWNFDGSTPYNPLHDDNYYSRLYGVGDVQDYIHPGNGTGVYTPGGGYFAEAKGYALAWWCAGLTFYPDATNVATPNWQNTV
jgi:hypothetical protein